MSGKTRKQKKRDIDKEAREEEMKAGHLRMMLDDSPNDPRID